MAVRQKKRAKTDPSFKNLKADYYPVQRTIPLGANSNASEHKMVDVGRLLSNVNHRLYRQGKTYKVKLDLDSQSLPGKYTVWALVDTWYVQKAWQLARATYEKSMADERASLGKSVARWEDFRVAHGISSLTPQIVTPYRYDTALTGSQDTNGEYDLSQITLSDGVTQRIFSWGATSGANLGILDEYDKTENVNIHSPPNQHPYAGVDDETQELSSDDLRDHGRAPPYAPLNFGSVWIKVCTLDSTIGGATSETTRLSTGYFNAPCGLIVIETPTPNTPLTGQILMTVQAGDYKGVAGMNIGV